MSTVVAYHPPLPPTPRRGTVSVKRMAPEKAEGDEEEMKENLPESKKAKEQVLDHLA